jgi:hypothetical protein
MTKFSSDIDIDVANRDRLLGLIDHIPASMHNVNPIRKHPTGIYVTDIPYDPVNNMSSIDYKDSENRGYVKLDILNVHVYNNIRDENHLNQLMVEPNWDKLHDKDFVENLIHIGKHYDNIQSMPEPIDSILKLAMFLAVIRPAKKHLIGKTWNEISKTIWNKESNGYSFKKSHAISYSWLVAIHMNLLEEQQFNPFV